MSKEAPNVSDYAKSAPSDRKTSTSLYCERMKTSVIALTRRGWIDFKLCKVFKHRVSGEELKYNIFIAIY